MGNTDELLYAKSAARSAFESTKQRFFNHLLTAIKYPTLIAAIARDLDAGHACVPQVVSTNEALLDPRLAQIPTSEWNDLSIDITPRRPRLSEPRLPDAALRALQRRERHFALAAGDRRRRQSGHLARSRRAARPDVPHRRHTPRACCNITEPPRLSAATSPPVTAPASGKRS
jgi:hypothetical protein